MMLAARLVGSDESLTAEHDAIRHNFALCNRRAQAPRGADEHLAVRSLAQAAAGGARGDERLDQHRHGRAGRVLLMLRHRAAGIGGPQRRPTGTQSDQEFGVCTNAEKAFELAGKIRIGAIFD